jgi:hypothetical protein
MKLRVDSHWRAGAVLAAATILAALAAHQFLADTRRVVAAEATEAGAKSKFDPVEANGPIFVDWPKPQLALVFSGELDGYLEPCGCAGLENQMGGLKRRHSLLKQLSAQGWPLVEFDLGGLDRRTGAQAAVKYGYALGSFIKMGYSAVGVGPLDVQLGPDALAAVIINLPADSNPLVVANIGIYGMQESIDNGFTRPYRVVAGGGKRIGVTSVLGARHATTAKNVGDLAYVPPAEGLAKVAPKLAAEKCDVQVLLVHGDPQEAGDLSRQFPQFQIVVTAGGAEEPPKQPATIPGSGALLIEYGQKGKYLSVVGFFNDPNPAKRYRYQRVPLDSRFQDSPEMQAQLVAYQKELETMTLAGLGLTGVAHPDGDFRGSETCADCHTKAWAKFEQTPHFHATDTLMKLTPPRHFDPECLSCHVTGWNPQEYFPYTTGYVSLEATPQMKQNGCENCHGPGGDHVDAETGAATVTDQQRDSLRAAMRLKIVPNEGNKEKQADGAVMTRCMICHDHDNSPDFDFQTFWPKIEHKGVD